MAGDNTTGIMGKVVVGLVLIGFSALSTVAISTGRQANLFMRDLNESVYKLRSTVLVLEERVARLPPDALVLQVDMLNKRLKRIEDLILGDGHSQGLEARIDD